MVSQHPPVCLLGVPWVGLQGNSSRELLRPCFLPWLNHTESKGTWVQTLLSNLILTTPLFYSQIFMSVKNTGSKMFSLPVDCSCQTLLFAQGRGQRQASLPVLNLGHSLSPVSLAGQEPGIEQALGKPVCGTEFTLLPGWLWDLTESTQRQQQQQSPPSLPHTEHGSAAWEVVTCC